MPNLSRTEVTITGTSISEITLGIIYYGLFDGELPLPMHCHGAGNPFSPIIWVALGGSYLSLHKIIIAPTLETPGGGGQPHCNDEEHKAD